MFTPKWKDEAKHLVKGARKFVHYKRDLLAEDRVDEIESRRTDLLEAIKSGDRAKVDEASKQLRAVCENALPREKPVGWLEENVEVMFVAIVVALGLRAYYLQPFRIPTGSMQPTLNGIIGTPLPESEWPSFPVRMWEKVMRGRSYVKIETESDENLRIGMTPDGTYVTDIKDGQFLHFFSRSVLRTTDGTTIRMPAPANPIYDAGLRQALEKAVRTGGKVAKGFVLCEGTLDSGDLVLVDKFSYHFRKPKRGEVFVFDTLGIRGIHEGKSDQAAGTHYIKRLAAVPGDKLEIQPPYILIDGKIAHEPGFEKVYNDPLHGHPGEVGYSFADPRAGSTRIAKPGDSITLRDKASQGMREYAALGDNSGNSLDSRYWGTVKEFNLVGPAAFTLWPITSGHWGFIH